MLKTSFNSPLQDGTASSVDVMFNRLICFITSFNLLSKKLQLLPSNQKMYIIFFIAFCVCEM